MNDDRLESWKDIAAYFRRDIRTVQRWEKLEGLPIHRHAHRSRSTPFAYVHELEEWLRNRNEDLGTATQLPGSTMQPLHELPSTVRSGPGTSSTQSQAPSLTVYPLPRVARPRMGHGLAGRRLGRLIASLAAVLLLAILTFGAGPAGRHTGPSLDWLPSPSNAPNWILVAEFDGPDDEPDLAIVVRELAISALADSRIVTPISRLELDRGLRDAMLPDTTHVVDEVARQLAYRAAARAYVEGRVDRVGGGFSVVLRMLDSDTGTIRFSISGLAEDRNHLIPMLDDLGRKLRRQLGEHQDVIRATRPFYAVVTPSFEAFQLYQASRDAYIRGQRTKSRRLAQEALRFDPDCAVAWWQVAQAIYDAAVPGFRDSAAVAYEEALHRPERLTEVQRLLVEAWYQYAIHYDLPAAYRAAREAVVRARGTEASMALNLLAMIAGYMGRTDEEFEYMERAASIAPFGQSQYVLLNLVGAELNHGGMRQAIQTSKKLIGLQRGIADSWIAVAALDWPRAERLARDLVSDPTMEAAPRSQATMSLATARAAQGHLRESEQVLQSVEDGSAADYWSWFATFAQSFLTVTLLNDADAHDLVPPRANENTDQVVQLGLLAAARADTLNARLALQLLDRRRVDEGLADHAVDAVLIEAWLAFDGGRWADVVRLLAPMASKGPYFWPGRVPCRWLVAEAYERLGSLEEAARAFEKSLDSAWTDTSDRAGLLGFVAPFAHAKLVILDSQLGRDAEAMQHWAALETVRQVADPALLPLLDEAAKAVATARPGA